MQRPTLFRRGLPLLLASGLVLTGAAACGDKDEDSADGVTTITVNAMPPETETVNRKNFLADVAEFEKKYPKIKIDAKEGKMDPKTFSTKLAGGQLEDVFYVYFTDPAQLIAKKQTADITPYLKEFPSVQNLKPDLMKVFKDEKGNVYGLPWTNYTLGLLYNRTVFTKAGLDPDKPPTTWAEVRTAAKKIADLGDGYVGYGDYSKNNTGGWHFTAEMYSIGGDIAVKNGDTWKAAFNNDKGRQILQQLYDMRWVDNSMGSKQLLEYADLLTMMGSGKLGMYVAAPDNIPTIVNQYKGNYADYGLGPIPGGVNALGGGEAFMFNAKSSPAKLRAGITWVTWMYANADRLEVDYARKNADKVPVGLPQPNLFTGADDEKQTAAAKKYGNVPTQNYAPFVAGLSKTPLKLEPPAAQQIYAALDTAMGAVLTDKNADIGKLLSDAEKTANQILAGLPK